MKKILIITVALFLLAGCTNKSLLRQQEFSKLDKNDYPAHINLLKKSKNYSSDEEFLKYFDQGILFHYNKQFDSSLVYLQAAEKTAEALYARSLTNEASAILVNDNMRPYRPKSYEETMLYNFMALNYLALGKIDEALVESRKGTLFLDKLAASDAKKYSTDGFFNYWSALAYENLNESDNSQISLYHALNGYRKNEKNLPAELSAYAYNSFKQGGRENDIAEFALNEQSKYLPKAMLADSLNQEIVIFCYGGVTPGLDELKFWGTFVEGGMLIIYHKDPSGKIISDRRPSPVLAASTNSNHYREPGTSYNNKISGKTTSISFALPQKQPSLSQTRSFVAECNGQQYASEVVASTDGLLDQYLDDENNTILMRTVIRVATRTIAAEAAKKNLKNKDNTVNLLINLGIDIFTGQLEMADLRAALFLPKTIQMIRIPCQNAKDITVKALSGNGTVLKSEQIAVEEKIKQKKLFYTFSSVK